MTRSALDLGIEFGHLLRASERHEGPGCIAYSLGSLPSHIGIKHGALSVTPYQDTGIPIPVVRSTLIFGIPFAHTKSARVIEVKVDGEVMEGLVHCSKVRYAIIQTSSKKDHPERVVLAYRDENCLRDLIVAASIVGPGFTSREEAMYKLVDSMPGPGAVKQMQLPAIPYQVQQTGNSEGGSGLTKNRRIIYRILQCPPSTITVLFYSKNLFSVVLRIALGFSS